MENSVNNITLATRIKWVIGNRIIFCLVLLSITVLATSIYDIIVGLEQSKKTLDSESKTLSEFIIAQSLINNQQGIFIKLDELNQTRQREKFEWQAKENISKQADIKWKFPLCWAYTYPVSDNDGDAFGEIHVSGSYFYDNAILTQLITKFILLLFFSLMMFFLLYPLSKRIPQDLFISPIMSLLSLLKNRSNISDKNNNATLPLELQEIQIKITELIDEITVRSREVALGQIATQVAHDIRSPLTVLDIVVKDIMSIPENQRILIRNATNRIHDIANNLLTFHNKKSEISNEIISENSSELIADLVSSTLSEKRAQYKNSFIEFNADIHESAYSTFANVSASSFKRVLSNLLDNAVESMQSRTDGTINIALNTELDSLTLSIQDMGTGITPDILQKITVGNIVTQKEKGHGLGLPYAIKMVEKFWNGKFTIQSSIGKGTKIDIVLPKMAAPSWFAPKLVISNTSTIVILDDDLTIHQVWNNRFKALGTAIKLIEFRGADELIAWYQNITSEDILFLVDYELIGNSRTGLDIIEQLDIASHSYLVTSRHEELEIRERCEKLGVRLIPKLFAAHIPICIISGNKPHPDLIFIDDNQALTQAWLLHGRRLGKNLVTFNNIEDFKSTMIHYQKKDIPIYVDSDLQNGISGQDFAKELYNTGFSNIYLATGYPSTHFGEMPWIKAIVGKEPPF